MATLTGLNNRHITPEEQRLYDHLLRLVELESPSQMIERFRTLFIDGVGYGDRQLLTNLDQVVLSKFADQEFRFVLNRCCHILINRWQTHHQMREAIPELIAQFEEPSGRKTLEYSRSRAVRRLRELTHTFTESEQYATLRRLAQVMNEAAESTGVDNRPLGTMIRRYPYLYKHCLLSEDSSYEHHQTVTQIQAEIQHKFEVDLSQYVTYQVRRAQIVRSSNPVQASRLLTPVKNPTLLSDRELGYALKQFVGKVEGPYSYRDLAQRFLKHSSHTPTFKAFKDDFYQYLTSSIDPEYGKRRFNNQLYAQLKNTLPDNDGKPLSDFLLVRICSQLLNFLILESSQKPHHFVFVDLVTNLGATLAMGLLLKIVLLCKKVKPHLEKRFAILFNHYESYTRDGVYWLILALENMNLALSTNFGSVDLSFLHKAV